jgi:hypothetical protein
MVGREVRDELEVPGHVLMIRPVDEEKLEQREQAMTEIKDVIKWGKEQGMKYLGELPEEKKQILRKNFGILGLKHDL